MQAYNKPELSPELLGYISNVAIEFDSTGEPLSRAARLLERLYAEAAYDGLDFEMIENNKDYVLEVASRLYGYNVQNFAIQDLDSKLTHIDESLSHVVGFSEVKERVKTFLFVLSLVLEFPINQMADYSLLAPTDLEKALRYNQ